MTKRRPFGSYDPNVRRSGESVTSSIPSVEEALRLKRKKKKSKTLTLGNDGSFLIDSTSKTPRISNRSKQLPPRRGTTKQLRRLEQSMASRAKQDKQQKRTNVVEVSDNAVKKLTEEVGTTGVKRKEHSGDNVVSKKRLKSPAADGNDKNRLAKERLEDKEVTVRRETQASTGTYAKPRLREVSVNVKRNQQEEVVSKKPLGRNVAADYLHKHRDSGKKTARPDLLLMDEETGVRRPERTKVPTEREENVKSKGQETEDAMMDCASDDESLHLSPGSSVASPVRENVEEDKAWVLKPPVQKLDQTPVPEVECEETENQDDRYPRLSMTTHAEGLDPLRTPSLVNVTTEKTPRWAKEPHRESAQPIVTKGMLARARQSKADNEDVFAAMLKSGPPYTGKKEESPASGASMIGTTIGINSSHERCDSLDGSEVTMLTTDSYLNDFPSGHTDTKHDTKLDDASGDSQLVDKKEMDRKASPVYDTAVNEASSSRAPKDRERRSSSRRISSIREPDESVDEGNQVIYFEHNGVMIPHPPLPSGWIIRMSQSKQRPFYCHPDHGSTWHCPVVLPQSSSDSILKTVYQPSFVRVTTRQNENAPDDDDDTESEDSEMWSRSHQQKGGDVESVSSRQSHTSLTSTSSAVRSTDTARSIAEAEAVEVTEDHGSELSLSSSVVNRGEPTGTREDDDVEQRGSPLVGEEVVCTAQLRHDDDMTNATAEMSPSQQAFKAGEKGPEMHSQTMVGSGTPRSVVESKAKDAAVASRPSVYSPSPGVARVSLLTEATTEELSPMVVEEIVSTAQFRRSSCGVVATQEMYGGGSDDEELVETNDSLGNTKESIGLIGVERDETFRTLLRESQSDNGSLAFVSKNGDSSKVHSRADEAEPATEAFAQGDTDDFEPVTEETAHDDANDFGVLDDDILEPAELEELETDAQSVSSKLERGDDEVLPTPKPVDPMESPQVHTEDEPRGEPEPEETVGDIASHRNGGGHYDDDVTLQENHGDFEAEVDDVVFGVDHDDIGLSPQAKRLSPIGHINSFDDGGEPLLTKTTPESDKDEPVGVSPPSTKNTSPIDHDDILDNGSVEGEEFEASHQDQHDGHLSVASSFTGTTSMGDYLSVKWRGYSHRVLHPPHPLCHLMSLEALIKAALRRAERRKKAKKSSKKSSRRVRRKTSTKLVFE